MFLISGEQQVTLQRGSISMGEMRKLIEGGLDLEKLREKVMPDEIVVERIVVPVA